MQPSFNRTLLIVAQGSRNPTTVVTAPSVPLRVVARNLAGGTTLLLAFSTEALSPTVTSEIFTVPAASEEVFILAPKQRIYATSGSAVADITATFACSEAFPVT